MKLLLNAVLISGHDCLSWLSVWYYAQMKINKEKLTNEIISHLEKELANCEQAAMNAHLAATDDQSVAETQYDTLAIESAYLAEGQSRRIVDCKKAISAFEQLQKSINNIPVQTIKLGSLIQLAADTVEQHWFFIAPAAAGYRTTLSDQHITVVTPYSPMGMALMGKQQDDEVVLRLGNNRLEDDITRVY